MIAIPRRRSFAVAIFYLIKITAAVPQRERVSLDETGLEARANSGHFYVTFSGSQAALFSMPACFRHSHSAWFNPKASWEACPNP
jgi:hypothetical protein